MAMGVSPSCSCPSHAGMGSLNPNGAFPARAQMHTVCPQSLVLLGDRLWLLHGGSSLSASQHKHGCPDARREIMKPPCSERFAGEEIYCCIQSPEGS